MSCSESKYNFSSRNDSRKLQTAIRYVGGEKKKERSKRPSENAAVRYIRADSRGRFLEKFATANDSCVPWRSTELTYRFAVSCQNIRAHRSLNERCAYYTDKIISRGPINDFAAHSVAGKKRCNQTANKKRLHCHGKPRSIANANGISRLVPLCATLILHY